MVGKKYGILSLGLLNRVLRCWVTLGSPVRKEIVSVSWPLQSRKIFSKKSQEVCLACTKTGLFAKLKAFTQVDAISILQNLNELDWVRPKAAWHNFELSIALTRGWTGWSPDVSFNLIISVTTNRNISGTCSFWFFVMLQIFRFSEIDYTDAEILMCLICCPVFQKLLAV